MWTRLLPAALVAVLAIAGAASARAGEQPNVLVIMSDDQRVSD
jgi:hypothetical protein